MKSWNYEDIERCKDFRQWCIVTGNIHYYDNYNVNQIMDNLNYNQIALLIEKYESDFSKYENLLKTITLRK